MMIDRNPTPRLRLTLEIDRGDGTSRILFRRSGFAKTENQWSLVGGWWRELNNVLHERHLSCDAGLIR